MNLKGKWIKKRVRDQVGEALDSLEKDRENRLQITGLQSTKGRSFVRIEGDIPDEHEDYRVGQDDIAHVPCHGYGFTTYTLDESQAYDTRLS